MHCKQVALAGILAERVKTGRESAWRQQRRVRDRSADHRRSFYTLKNVRYGVSGSIFRIPGHSSSLCSADLSKQIMHQSLSVSGGVKLECLSELSGLSLILGGRFT